MGSTTHADLPEPTARRGPGGILKSAVAKVLAGGLAAALLLGASVIVYFWLREESPRLLVSRSADRSRPKPLEEQTLAAPLYVFVTAHQQIRQVEFFVDRVHQRTDREPPFDLNGTTAAGAPIPWTPSNGWHSITARVTMETGSTETRSGRIASFSGVDVGAASTPIPTVGPPAGPTACRGRSVLPGDDVSAMIEAAGPHASFCLKKGLYRLTRPVVPKDGQTLQGEPGTVIDGSRILSGFRRSGAHWVADGYLPAQPTRRGVCRPAGYTGCQYGEAVFFDQRPLWRVMRLGDLGPGKFYQDYGRNQVYLADDPTRHTVEQSIVDELIHSQASKVTVRGLILQKAKTSGLRSSNSDGWRIEFNEARLNHGFGMVTGRTATGSVVRGNHTHHNGEVGLGGGGSDGLFVGNEIDHNNTAGYDQFWAGAGAKWAYSLRLTLRGNYSHDNAGPGLWVDLDSRDTTIEGNRVARNAGPGIFYEISQGAIIRENLVEGNAFDPIYRDWYVGAGICVAESPHVDVYRNRVVDNANGITVVMQARGRGPFGLREARDNHVHDNLLVMPAGVSGLADNTGSQASWASRMNRFTRNTYRLDSLESPRWVWEGESRTKQQWVASGQDRDGRFMTL
jgi:parallel beta-helix repeat protein